MTRVNEYEIQGNCVIMYTSKGEPFYVDIEDYDKVKDIYWHIDKDGYVKGKYNGSDVRIHRVIMGYPDCSVDHIHGEQSRNDNRKENLRLATVSQNAMNIGLKTNNTSGYTGVSWDKSKNKWKAQIGINNKMINLGRFSNLEDAIYARQEAEKKYFGEWSYINSQGL